MKGERVAYVWICEVKTFFAYETLQKITYHLLFVLDMLCIAYLGAIFSRLKFIVNTRSPEFILPGSKPTEAGK